MNSAALARAAAFAACFFLVSCSPREGGDGNPSGAKSSDDARTGRGESGREGGMDDPAPIRTWPAEWDSPQFNPALKVNARPSEESYPLGMAATVRVEIENAGDETVRCTEVTHDILSAYLEFSYEDSLSAYIRIQPEYFNPVFQKGEAGPYLPFINLGTREKAATEIRFVLPRAGTYRVRGVYRGLGPTPLFFRSEWNSIAVEPAGEARELRVLAQTDLGDLEFAFRPDAAMATTVNFLTLVQRNFYDGLTFHYVDRKRCIQAGDPAGNGSGNPSFYIPQEFNRLPHMEGALSMARTKAHVDTAGSQFFICFGLSADERRLFDGAYTVFGRVVSGMDTALKIGDTPVDAKLRPLEPVRITRMILVKK